MSDNPCTPEDAKLEARSLEPFAGKPGPLTFVPMNGNLCSFMLAFDTVPSDRNVLIARVSRGELTREDAEVEARSLGLEPLAFSPNPSIFDPMKEMTWSLLMCLAWVRWRTPEAVREVWNLYRKDVRFWAPRSWREPRRVVYHRRSLLNKDERDIFTVTPPRSAYHGYSLVRKDPARLSDLSLSTAPNLPQGQPFIDNHLQAFRLLRSEAVRGWWKATGLPTDDKRRREISPLEWEDFEVYQTKDDLAVRVKSRGTFGYDCCAIPVAGLLRSIPMDASDLKRSTVAVPNVSEASQRSLRGRKTGSGSFENNDAPLACLSPLFRRNGLVHECQQGVGP
jgi:hypothetical protein